MKALRVLGMLGIAIVVVLWLAGKQRPVPAGASPGGICDPSELAQGFDRLGFCTAPAATPTPTPRPAATPTPTPTPVTPAAPATTPTPTPTPFIPPAGPPAISQQATPTPMPTPVPVVVVGGSGTTTTTPVVPFTPFNIFYPGAPGYPPQQAGTNSTTNRTVPGPLRSVGIPTAGVTANPPTTITVPPVTGTTVQAPQSATQATAPNTPIISIFSPATGQPDFTSYYVNLATSGSGHFTSATAMRDPLSGRDALVITDDGRPANAGGSGNGNGQVIIGVNNGAGAFRDPSQVFGYSIPPGGVYVAQGDFGFPSAVAPDDHRIVGLITTDPAFAGYFRAVQAFSGQPANAKPVLESHLTSPVSPRVSGRGPFGGPAGAFRVAAGDVEGNSLDDIITVTPGDDPKAGQSVIHVFTPQADGSFGPAGPLITAPILGASIAGGRADVHGNGALGTVDFNSDGKADFVLGGWIPSLSTPGSYVPAILPLLAGPIDGPQFVIQPVIPLAPDTPQSVFPQPWSVEVAVADATGNGGLGLAALWGDPTNANVSWLPYQVAGGFQAPVTLATGLKLLQPAALETGSGGRAAGFCPDRAV